MLGQDNIQYEWHPLIDDKYLLQNNLTYERTPNMIIYKFDRSNCFRLDELLDSLLIIKLHGGQALYIMKAILEKYIALKTIKLEPEFISCSNIWIVFEQGSAKFKAIFSSPLHYKICFTYNSKQGTIQDILGSIIQILPICQSENDQKDIKSERYQRRKQLIETLTTLRQNNSLEMMLNFIKESLIKLNYNQQEQLSIDSQQYYSLGNRGTGHQDVIKNLHCVCLEIYNVRKYGVSQEQYDKLRGLFIQKAIMDARSALFQHLSSMFGFSNIPMRVDEQQIEIKIKQFCYSSLYIQKFIEEYITNIKNEFEDFYLSEQFNNFKLSLKDHFIEFSIIHNKKCQEYLLINGYFNSVYDFDRKIDDKEMMQVERQLFNTNVAPLIAAKYMEYSYQQLKQVLEKLA